MCPTMAVSTSPNKGTVMLVTTEGRARRRIFNFQLICRGDPTRTGDHLVPNQVRYQLRYTPMPCRHDAKSGAKVQIFPELCKNDGQKFHFLPLKSFFL